MLNQYLVGFFWCYDNGYDFISSRQKKSKEQNFQMLNYKLLGNPSAIVVLVLAKLSTLIDTIKKYMDYT